MSNILRNNKHALAKTASYYVVHVVVAVMVALAVTGSWAAAVALSFLEPTVQAVAFFIHEKLWAKATPTRFTLAIKTGTYYVMHIFVAAAVTYSVTGDILTALTLSLLEPTVQMAVFYFHEKVWARRQALHLKPA